MVEMTASSFPVLCFIAKFPRVSQFDFVCYRPKSSVTMGILPKKHPRVNQNLYKIRLNSERDGNDIRGHATNHPRGCELR